MFNFAQDSRRGESDSDYGSGRRHRRVNGSKVGKKGTATYRVAVTTGNKKNAGTDANVRFRNIFNKRFSQFVILASCIYRLHRRIKCVNQCC